CCSLLSSCAPDPLHSFPTRRSSDLHLDRSSSPHGPVVKVARAVNQPFTVCEAALPHFSSIRDANDARLPRKAKRLMFGHCTYLQDRKSTRLNSSHEWISYAVFCLKK